LDDSTFQQLQQQDWHKINNELILHTAYIAKSYSWQSGGTAELAKGSTLKDIVQHVIEKTLNGDRKWDPDKGPLMPWLKDQVNSVVDALYKSATNRREVRLREDESSTDILERGPTQASHLLFADTQVTPEELLLAEEDALLVKQQVDFILDLVSNKPELEDVVLAILDGCEPKPRFIAKQLDVEVKEINNRLKRLCRLAIKEGTYE